MDLRGGLGGLRGRASGGVRAVLGAAWRWLSCDGLPVEPVGRVVVLSALALMGVGVLMVYSASSARNAALYGDAAIFLRRQLVWAALGVIVVFLTMRTDPRKLERWARPALFVTLAALALVLLPQVGTSVKGARRWLRLGPVSFQPSEAAKIVLVVFLAAHLARRRDELGSWRRGVLPAVGALGATAFLVLIEPDFGTALFLGAVGGSLMILGGVPIRRLALASTAAVPVLGWQVYERWNVVVRRFSVLSRENADPAAVHQVEQALVAFGSGGWFGLGVGAGRQKLFFLPEAPTDFILPVVGEELGFLGTAAVLMLFGTFVLYGLRIVLAAATAGRFEFLLAFGLVFHVGLQAAGNIAVVTGSVPTKGIALPFISLGGSSLLVLCASVGLIYAVSARIGAAVRTSPHDLGALRGPLASDPVLRGVPA